MWSTPHKTFLTRLYVTATIVFVVLLVSMLSIRLTISKEAGYRSATEHFNLVNHELTVLFIEANNMVSDQFRDKVANLHGQKGLSAILIHNPDMVYYAYSVEKDLVQPIESPPQKLIAPSLHLLLTAPFMGDDDITVSAVYRLITKESEFRIIRDTLFLVLTFKLVCAISLLGIVIFTRQSIGIKEPLPKENNEPKNDPLNKSMPTNFLQKQGLAPQEQFLGRLSRELQRATVHNTELSLVLGLLLTEKDTKDNSARIANVISQLPVLPDLAYCYGETCFALVRPGDDLRRTIVQIEQWRQETVRSGLCFAIGISDRSGRQVEGNRLVLEAEQALGRAVKATGGNLVAFRADAKRYQMLHDIQGE